MFSPIWLTYFLSFMLSIITKKFSIDLTDSFKVSWSTLSKCVFNTLFYLLADCFYTVSVQFAPNTFDEILLDCACSLSHLWRVLWFMALLIKTFYQSVTSWRPWIYISLWFLYPTQDGCSSPIFIQEHLLLWSNVWNMSSSSTLVRKPSGVRFLSAAAKMAWASGLSTIGRPRWNWPLTLTQRGQWLC